MSFTAADVRVISDAAGADEAAAARILAGHFADDDAHAEARIAVRRLREAGAVDLGGGLMLGRWAESHTTERPRTGVTGYGPPLAQPLVVPAFSGRVSLDPRLPVTGRLLGILADWAGRKQVTVVVRRAELGGAVAGRLVRDATVVLAGPAGHRAVRVQLVEVDPAFDVAATFVHEAAHLLDPSGRLGEPGEHFAEVLADLLRRWPPADLAGLDRLVEAADVIAGVEPAIRCTEAAA